MRLRKLRIQRGLTQAELADRCSLTQPQVSDYEAGRNQPRARNLAKLARELRVPVEALKHWLTRPPKRRRRTGTRGPLRRPGLRQDRPGCTAPGQGAPLRSRKEKTT
jgi:transcriptional regulator with XRE-family HTH domain